MLHLNSLIFLKLKVWARCMRSKSSCRAALKTDFIPCISWRLFCPTVGIPPCCCTNPQNACAQSVSYFCLVQNSVDAFFCDVQAAFGAFHCIGNAACTIFSFLFFLYIPIRSVSLLNRKNLSCPSRRHNKNR